MQPDFRTAFAEDSPFELRRFVRRHPLERVGIERGSFATAWLDVNADGALGVVEPRISERNEKRLRSLR